jgi:hypothetical protein
MKDYLVSYNEAKAHYKKKMDEEFNSGLGIGFFIGALAVIIGVLLILGGS